MSQTTTSLQKLYVAYFNRAADPGGLAYWEGVVNSMNGDTSRASAEFAGSKEYRDTYAGLSNVQIVNKVYQNLFGRDGEAAGVQFWADHLDAGHLTIDNVVTEIARGAQGTDLGAFNAKVDAAGAFTRALNDGSKAGAYSGLQAIELARNFLSGVTDAASEAHAVARLDKTVSNLLNIPLTSQGISLHAGANSAELSVLNANASAPVTLLSPQGQLDLKFDTNGWGYSQFYVPGRYFVSDSDSLAAAADSVYSSASMPWFVYKGDTYVSVGTSGSGYRAGRDWLVKIPGVFDLSDDRVLNVDFDNHVLHFNFERTGDRQELGQSPVSGTAGGDAFSATYNNSSSPAAPTVLQLDGGAGYDYLGSMTWGGNVRPDYASWQINGVENVNLAGVGALNLDARNWSGLKELAVQLNGEVHLTLASDTNVRLLRPPFAGVQVEGIELQINGGHDIEINNSGYRHISVGAQTAATGDVSVSHYWYSQDSDNSLVISGGRHIKGIMQTAPATSVQMTVNGDAHTESVAAANLSHPWADGKKGNATVMITDAGFASGSAGSIKEVQIEGSAVATIRAHGLQHLELGGTTYSSTPAAIAVNLENARNTDGNLYLHSQNVSRVALTDSGAIHHLYWAETSPVLAVNVDFVPNLPQLQDITLSGRIVMNAASLTQLGNLRTVNIADSASLSGNLASTAVTSVVSTGKTALNLTLDPGKTAFGGGSGDDIVRLASDSHFDNLQVINGGMGNDTLIMTSAQKTALQNLNKLELFQGFETIAIDDGPQRAIAHGDDLPVIGHAPDAWTLWP